MKKTMERVAACLLLAVLITLPGCKTSATKESGTESGASMILVVEGVPGGVIVETQEVSAEVVEIDYENRTATLKEPSGNLLNFAPGPEAINFDQVKKGDLVRVTATATLNIYLGDDLDEMLDGIEGSADLADKGERPGAFVAETIQMTATVTAVDLEKRTATLRFRDGTVIEAEVRPDVELTKKRVGQKVVIRSTTEVILDVVQQ